MDTAHYVPQFGQRLLGLLLGFVEEPPRGLGVAVVSAFREPDPHGQRYQPRLRAVVQVPLDAAQFGTVRGDGARPRLGQLLDPLGQPRLR
jgi:hypothetical protein